MVSGTEFLLIVLVIGFIIIAIVAVFALIQFVSHLSSLSEAKTNLENAFFTAYSAFETFAAAIAASVERFVIKMRDLILAFTRTISVVFNKVLRFAVDFFTTIVAWVDHTWIRIQEEFMRMESKVRLIIVDAALILYNKLITVPVEVGTTIILDFTSLVTGVIHTIFCYVFTGFAALTDSITGIVDDLKVWFNNNIYQPIAKLLNPIAAFVNNFPMTIQVFFDKLFTQIFNSFPSGVITPIINLLEPIFAPLVSAVESLQSISDYICSIPFIGC